VRDADDDLVSAVRRAAVDEAGDPCAPRSSGSNVAVLVSPGRTATTLCASAGGDAHFGVAGLRVIGADARRLYESAVRIPAADPGAVGLDLPRLARDLHPLVSLLALEDEQRRVSAHDPVIEAGGDDLVLVRVAVSRELLDLGGRPALRDVARGRSGHEGDRPRERLASDCSRKRQGRQVHPVGHEQRKLEVVALVDRGRRRQRHVGPVRTHETHVVDAPRGRGLRRTIRRPPRLSFVLGRSRRPWAASASARASSRPSISR
jgi:hypothetical protein